MPARTPLDNALNSKNTFLAFTGLVTAVAVWTIWGTEIFPKQNDPTGGATGDPSTWTAEEMKQWLNARNLHPNSRDTRDELLERVRANLRLPRA